METDDKAKVEATKESVVNSNNFTDSYVYDTKRHLWCEISFSVGLTMKKVDFSSVLRELATRSVIWETRDIKRAITYMKNGKLTLRTDGINISEMFKYDQLLNLNRLYSNDIHKIAETYGIEAAAKVVVREVQDVFAVYGITVDPRHLLLVADYMTFSGVFEPMNRTGMESSASALQQMSFESSLVFLRNAVVRGKKDGLQNPSSCLMVGKPCRMGTGCFELLHRMPVVNK